MMRLTRKRDAALPIPVVIAGMDCATGLQTARIFGRRGITVIGVVENARHFACRTRYCHDVITTEADGLTATLERLGKQLPERSVLIPCSDSAVLQISSAQDRLRPSYRLALPQHGIVETLLDKGRFYQFAAEHKWPIPQTYYLRTRPDACYAAERITYPCILKPAVKTRAWESQIKTKAFKINSEEELLSTFDRCEKWSSLLTVQQWVEGSTSDLYTCNCVFDENSRAVATFVSRKLRQWPLETGIGCLAEECENEAVRNTTIELFTSVGFQGLAYLEMKHDPTTDRYVIIEANVGRPTGRSAAAEASGVELLYTLYCDLVGLPLPEKRQQQHNGAKWIYWRRDLSASFAHWRRGELTLGQWLRSVRGRKVCAVLSWTDPMPFVLDLWQSLAKKRRHKPSVTPRVVARATPTAPKARQGVGVP